MSQNTENSKSVLNIGFLRSSLLETKGLDLLRPNLFFTEFLFNDNIKKDLQKYGKTENLKRLFSLIKSVSLPERKINVIEYKRMGKKIQIPTTGEWESDLTIKFYLDDKRKILSFLEYLYNYSQNRRTSEDANRKIWNDEKFSSPWYLTIYSVSRQWLSKDLKDNSVSEDSEKFKFFNKWGQVLKTIGTNAIGSIPGAKTFGFSNNWNTTTNVAEIASEKTDIDQLGQGYIQSFKEIFIKSISNIEFDYSTDNQLAEVSVTFGFTDTFLGPVEWSRDLPIEELYPLEF